jgi:hypothetical protein
LSALGAAFAATFEARKRRSAGENRTAFNAAAEVFDRMGYHNVATCGRATVLAVAQTRGTKDTEALMRSSTIALS